MVRQTYLIVTFVCFGFFIFAAGSFISLPGLYDDEVAFASISFRMLGDAVKAPIGLSFFGWPVTMSPMYVGAIKAYVMAPIFWLFGFSYLTLRLPMILVSATSLCLIARFLRPRMGALAAALALLLAATDPLFIYATKIDWGPTTLAALFRCLAIGFLFRFFDTRRTRDMALFLGACALGLWDKSNFIWVMIGLGAASMVFYRAPIKDWIRATPRKEILKTISPFAVIYLFIFFVIILHSMRKSASQHPPLSAKDYVSRIDQIYQLYVSSASGQNILAWAFGENITHPAFAPRLAAYQTLFGLALSLPFKKLKHIPWRRELGFLSVTIFLIFVQAVITPEAGGPHHVVVFWPLVQVQLVLCALVIGSWIKKPSPAFVLASIAFSVFVVFLATTAVRADGDYLMAMCEHRTNQLFRPEIADLASKLEGLPVDKIYTVDWGLYYPLIALTKKEDRSKFEDTLGYFMAKPSDEKKVTELYGKIVNAPHVALISYVDDVWPKNHSVRDYLLQDWLLCSHKTIFVPKTTGEPLYRIDLIEPCPPRQPRY